MSRRRRTKYTWFPVNGSRYVDGEDSWTDSIALIPFTQVGPSRAQEPAQFNFPVVPDFTVEQGQNTTDNSITLRDKVEGQDWLLKRLVGKIHISCIGQAASQGEDTVWPFVSVTAGFFVARAQDDSQNQIDLNSNEFSPTAADNIQDPWIWRRTWLLCNPSIASGTSMGNLVSFSGPSNFGQAGGSVADGPHIDSKVSRRIRREHRLWFVVSATGWNPNAITYSNAGIQPYIIGQLDLRVLGTLRKGKNSSSF